MGSATRSTASFFGSNTLAYGVSEIVLPAYLVSIGLGSNVSMWLTPPFMNSQITLLAFGAKCGRPFGGAQAPELPKPSLCRIAPSARPANPIPVLDRKARRDGLFSERFIADPLNAKFLSRVRGQGFLRAIIAM